MALYTENLVKGEEKIAQKSSFQLTLKAVPGHTIFYSYFRPNGAVPNLLEQGLAQREHFFNFLVSTFTLPTFLCYIVPQCTARWRGMPKQKYKVL